MEFEGSHNQNIPNFKVLLDEVFVFYLELVGAENLSFLWCLNALGLHYGGHIAFA